jgi:hypothetical protein
VEDLEDWELLVREITEGLLTTARAAAAAQAL